MRLPLSRITALVALCAALSTVVVLSVPRIGNGGRERDRVVRMTRGGFQRFDAADAISRDNENPEPMAAVAADDPSASAGQLSAHAPPGGDARLTAGPVVRPPSEFFLLPHHLRASLALVQRPHPHPGRAPPSRF